MKKNSKGFTLIELLVVVAIIGILAAVGVVAYNGYTTSAKKGSSKTIHSQTVKFLAAESKKCELGETTFFASLSCTGVTRDLFTRILKRMLQLYSQIKTHIAQDQMQLQQMMEMTLLLLLQEIRLFLRVQQQECYL